MTVHIVEDDHGVRDALSELCRSVGRKVRLYADGEEFCRDPVLAATDVVLIDLGLPGMHGTEVIRRIATFAVQPKVIVISGLPLGEISHALRDFVDVHVMRKPLAGDLLISLL